MSDLAWYNRRAKSLGLTLTREFDWLQSTAHASADWMWYYAQCEVKDLALVARRELNESYHAARKRLGLSCAP